MNGQQPWVSGSKSAYRDIDQLLQHGRNLHNQAIFEALEGAIKRLKTVLRKSADFSFGANRLKQN